MACYPEKRLAEILAGLDCDIEGDPSKISVRFITDDSRLADRNSLFVAVRGCAVDGHGYLDDAMQRGCRAVVVERGFKFSSPLGGIIIRVSDTRAVLGRMAAAFFDYPARRLKLIGITGTNGKTTTTYLLEAIIRAAGGSPGVIGTVNYRYSGIVRSASHTTPAPLALQSLLSEMAADGVTHVVMEVSSHALEQGRLEGVAFDAALFTNLSRDHLDYHGDMERYFASKKRLFLEYLKDGGKAVVISSPAAEHGGREDGSTHDWGRRLAAELPWSPEWQAAGRSRADIVMCGGRNAAVTVESSRQELTGIEADLLIDGECHTVRSSLLGPFNLRNILGAVGVSRVMGIDPAVIVQALAGETRVPGRLEKVDSRAGINVVVDYAHTPDALANVLAALRELAPARLIVVFGCGGDRDRGKRSLMGRVAGRLADIVILTSDNPRSEDPVAIIKEIEMGLFDPVVPRMRAEALCRRRGLKGYDMVVSRRRAIEVAVRCAGPGDLVAICGKGHEDYQQIGAEKIFFDDRLEAARQRDVIAW